MLKGHGYTPQPITRLAVALAWIGLMSGIALPAASPRNLTLQAGDFRIRQSRASLTLEERIGYQRAVEEVYWRHRVWPGRRRIASRNRPWTWTGTEMIVWGGADGRGALDIGGRYCATSK